MNGQLRSYLPENILLDGKHQQHTRMCHEELAVIDPANGYRVIAYRGSIPLKEQNMQKLFGISAKETDFLECT